MPLYIVCGVFDIVLFSVQNYCNQDICNRIYTSLRHERTQYFVPPLLKDVHPSKIHGFFLLYMRFFLIEFVVLMINVLLFLLSSLLFLSLQILLLLVFCCNSMASHSKQRLLLYNSDAAKPSLALFLIII